MSFSKSTYQLLILLLSSALFIPFLGGVHLFDWDEINFAECAREMIVTGNYSTVQINFQPFWEKPPLFIWMQVVSMKLFGINEFAARFPNAVCGIITLLFLFNAGTRLVNEKYGLLWMGFYLCSFLPHLYFRSGIIDPWFNLFIFSSLYYLYLFQVEKKLPRLVFSAFVIGLAMLTKGPVAFLVLGLSYFIISALNRFSTFLSIRELMLYLFIAVISGSLWFILLVTEGKTQVISDFIRYQLRLFSTEDSGHGGPFYYHFIVLLLGCFPASVFALGAFKKSSAGERPAQDFMRWMKVLFWVVLILFSIVKTKIIHYSSLCYFPLTFLAASVAYKLMKSEANWKKIQTGLFAVISFSTGAILVVAGLIEKLKASIINSNAIKDDFAIANLQADVTWKGYEFIVGILFISLSCIAVIFLIKKKYRLALCLAQLSCLLTISSSIYLFVPNIEGYSQRSAIEFYKEKSEEDCYVETLGFKSYATLFYTDKRPPQDTTLLNNDWLLNNKTDKPVYFVCKVNRADEYKKQYPFLKELYRKNGFVFLHKSTD